MLDKTTMNRLITEAHKNAVEHGFWEEVNIDRAVMLVITEIGEAIEADRNGCHSLDEHLQDYLLKGKLNNEWFELNIKDDFEDEIADIFIRIFDLMGHLEIEYEGGNLLPDIGLYTFLRMVTQGVIESDFVVALWCLESLCDALKLDIEPFILAKMKYNSNRPYKHGKKF